MLTKVARYPVPRTPLDTERNPGLLDPTPAAERTQSSRGVWSGPHSSSGKKDVRMHHHLNPARVARMLHWACQGAYLHSPRLAPSARRKDQTDRSARFLIRSPLLVPGFLSHVHLPCERILVTASVLYHLGKVCLVAHRSHSHDPMHVELGPIRRARQIAAEKNMTTLTRRANQKFGAGDFFVKNLIFYAAEN